MVDTLFLVLFWSGPVGIGLFLVCLGIFIWLLAKADALSKQTKALSKEKGLDKK